MMPIVHDLIKHFKLMNLDWIEREFNTVADRLAKNGSMNQVGFKPSNPDFFKLRFDMRSIMNTPF